MQVVRDGRRCECGNRGCWEQYSSGNALVREARELVVGSRPRRTACGSSSRTDLTGSPVHWSPQRPAQETPRPLSCSMRSATGWAAASRV